MPLIRCRRRCSRRRGRLRACPLWVGEEGGLASPLVGLGLEPRVGELVLLLPPPATVTKPRGCRYFRPDAIGLCGVRSGM